MEWLFINKWDYSSNFILVSWYIGFMKINGMYHYIIIINGNPPIVFLGVWFIKPRVSETLIGTPKTPVSDSPKYL
jgi:hypothetical protein